MSDRDDLKAKLADAGNVIRAQANVLDSTVNPKIAREARDVIFEATERAVEVVDQIHRIDDRIGSPEAVE